MSELALNLIRQAKAEGSTTLDLGRTGLTKLPEELFELIELETLILSNQIWDAEKLTWRESPNTGSYNLLYGILPDGFKKLKNLQSLYVSGIGFQFIGVGYFFHNWAISDIRVLGELKHLSTLDLSCNRFSNIEVLEELPNLSTLYLQSNEISNIAVLEKLTRLTSLDLSGNKISNIQSLQNLTNLTKLTLDENKISDIGSLEKLTKLTVLDLYENKISDIKVLEKLTKLTVLNLCVNEIRDIVVLEKLPQLTSLDLSFNKISDIKVLANLKNLSKLVLSGNEISDIGVLANLTELTSLYLSNNQISDIEVLGNLDQLTSLNLSTTQISDINGLQNLKNLTELTLSDNEISDIEVLANLIELTSLELRDNQINDIGALGNLNQLTSLYLSDNQINDIGALGNLNQLTSLYLSNNQISDIAILAKLTQLTHLHLSGNQISDINILQHLPNLQAVSLMGNPIKKIPKAFIEEYDCLPHLRAWWAETADPTHTQPNRTVKLMLTGNSNTGKSTLVHALKEGKCAEDKKSTDGIQLEQWEYVEDEKAVRFCIWDFGGQEIFHGTHRLFLSAEAIQLILFDPATERSAEANKPTPNRLRIEEANRNLPLQYWIDTVQELSPDSQVIVVQNKKDQESARYATAYKTTADANWEFRQVSAWTGEGIKSLRLALHENATELNEYEMPMPKSWLAVQQYFLDNMNQEVPERLLPYAEFERRCREEYGVLDISISSLLTLLHHNGVVYYNKQYLKDTIIADQRWALDAVYKPLHHGSDFYDNMRKDWFGNVRVKHIFEALGVDYKNEEKRLFLNLMRSCALCFSLKEKENHAEDNENTRYIFPEFLLPDVPEAVQDKLALKKPSLHFYRRQYDYLNYYRIQTFITSVGQKTPLKYIWRNGILIETAEGIFTVEADYENHAILISIEESAINRWLYEIIEELENHDNIEEVAQFWSVSTDKENDSPADLASLRNRAAHQTAREEGMHEEKKSLAEQLPDVVQVDAQTNAWLIDLERNGIEKYLRRLIEKKNTFLDAHAIASDAAQKFRIKTSLDELEKEIESAKAQLTQF